MRQAVGGRQQAETEPRAAYIHVPFCRHRCGYCNFTLVAGRDELILPFLSALERELSLLGSPREVDTLFFGGGTPTHLRGEQLRRLLELVLRWHPLSENAEFSVEANPSDIDAETGGCRAEHSVTRHSSGAQSFDTAKAQLLERDDPATEIAGAVEVARNRGLAVSIDLIFATPGETLDAWRRDLQFALNL